MFGDCHRQQQVKEAMKKMDDLVAEYRKVSHGFRGLLVGV